jgi:outer membrane lipoprotein SlyB
MSNNMPNPATAEFQRRARCVDRCRHGVALLVGLCLIAGGAAQTSAQTPPARIRGEILASHGAQLELKADDGQRIAVTLADKYSISARSAATQAMIVPNAFLGATAIPAADGTLVATEVHIFPESMRGTGEGHRPMDPASGSTMTNATVASVASGAPASANRTMTNATVAAVAGSDQERRMTLRYGGGEKVIAIPKGTPIVMVEAGDASMLVAGAHVIVSGKKQGDGSMLVDRVWVGKDGFVPPL